MVFLHATEGKRKKVKGKGMGALFAPNFLSLTVACALTSPHHSGMTSRRRRGNKDAEFA
jgi:hypothetical protein